MQAIGPPSKPDPRHESRYQYLRISPELVMANLGNRHTETEYLIPVASGLPANVEVVAVAYDFLLRLYHPSFDPVEPGHQAPLAQVTISLKTIPRNQDGSWRDRPALFG